MIARKSLQVGSMVRAPELEKILVRKFLGDLRWVPSTTCHELAGIAQEVHRSMAHFVANI
jgi:hypothetical protein